MDITGMSVTELKALAFDTLADIQRLQSNLNTIQNEIAKKNEAKPIEAEKVEEVADGTK